MIHYPLTYILKFESKPTEHNPVHNRKQVCCQQHSILCPLCPNSKGTPSKLLAYYLKGVQKNSSKSNIPTSHKNIVKKTCLKASGTDIPIHAKYFATKIPNNCKRHPVTCPFCGCCQCLKTPASDNEQSLLTQRPEKNKETDIPLKSDTSNNPCPTLPNPNQKGDNLIGPFQKETDNCPYLT